MTYDRNHANAKCNNDDKVTQIFESHITMFCLLEQFDRNTDAKIFSKNKNDRRLRNAVAYTEVCLPAMVESFLMT